LIVKLYSIEINCLADLFVHCDISAVLVMLLFEVRGLRRMDDDMVGKPGSKCGLEPYQPLFSCTCFHRTIVLPVDIDTIQVIREHEICQVVCGFNCLSTLSGRKLSCPKC
jgi:hypothetical protein